MHALLPQDVLHLLSLRQLVEVAAILGQGVLDLLDAVDADQARDLRGIGVELRLLEELLDGRPLRDVLLDLSLGEAGQSGDHLLQVRFGTTLLLDLVTYSGSVDANLIFAIRSSCSDWEVLSDRVLVATGYL